MDALAKWAALYAVATLTAVCFLLAVVVGLI
jgi:hypothetical protein